MPIPAASISHAEVHLNGQIAAGGSGTKNTDYVFHYRRTTTVNPLSKANLDTIFQSTVAAKVLLATNVRWSQTNNTIRWVDDALDPFQFFTHANPGAIGTDGMSGFDTVYMLIRTAYRGKSYRGSKHFTGLSEADTTQPNDDVLNAGAIALWGAVVTAMKTPLVDASGNTWVLEVLSRKQSQLVLNPTTVVATDAVDVLLNKRIGRMTRRETASVY